MNFSLFEGEAHATCVFLVFCCVVGVGVNGRSFLASVSSSSSMSDPIREREKNGRKKAKIGELGDGPSSFRSPWYLLDAFGHIPGVGFDIFADNTWGEKAAGDGGEEAEAELDPLMIFGWGIMMMILNKLDARSVARSRLVSREWLKVASSDMIWAPKVPLFY